MKVNHLTHRHGGKITEIRAIAHETWKGVASWHFLGTVEWEDGGKSDKAEIGPWAVCVDPNNPQSKDEERIVFNALSDYLRTQGEYHDAKHKRDGRVYSWTPKAKAGHVPL